MKCIAVVTCYRLDEIAISGMMLLTREIPFMAELQMYVVSENELNLRGLFDQKFNRRRFFQLCGIGLFGVFASGVSLEQLAEYSQEIYVEQNRRLVLDIIGNPPPLLQFGTLLNPDEKFETEIRRFNSVRKDIGVQTHLGIFTTFNKIETPAGAYSLLNQLKAAQWNKLTPQLALGNDMDHDDGHILSDANLPKLTHEFECFAQIVRELGDMVEAKVLYEMNSDNFNYSRGKYGMSDADQIKGFERAILLFDYVMRREGVRDKVKIIFNPTAHQPFLEYIQNSDVWAVIDEFALNIYDYNTIIGSNLPFGMTFPPGKVSPQQILDEAVTNIYHAARGKPVSVGELGTKCNDVEWMKRLVLGLAAYPGKGITKLMYFDVNKVGEADFRMTSEMRAVFRNIFQLINFAHQPISKYTDQKILQVAKNLGCPISPNQLQLAQRGNIIATVSRE